MRLLLFIFVFITLIIAAKNFELVPPGPEGFTLESFHQLKVAKQYRLRPGDQNVKVSCEDKCFVLFVVDTKKPLIINQSPEEELAPIDGKQNPLATSTPTITQDGSTEKTKKNEFGEADWMDKLECSSEYGFLIAKALILLLLADFILKKSWMPRVVIWYYEIKGNEVERILLAREIQERGSRGGRGRQGVLYHRIEGGGNKEDSLREKGEEKMGEKGDILLRMKEME